MHKPRAVGSADYYDNAFPNANIVNGREGYGDEGVVNSV